MQKSFTVKGKTYSAKQIVAQPILRTHEGEHAIMLKGLPFNWRYRCKDDGTFAPVFDPSDANCISITSPVGGWSVLVQL